MNGWDFYRLWAYLVWLDYGRHSAHEEVSLGCPICMLVFWRVLCIAGLTVRSPVATGTQVVVLSQLSSGGLLPKDMMQTEITRLQSAAVRRLA